MTMQPLPDEELEAEAMQTGIEQAHMSAEEFYEFLEKRLVGFAHWPKPDRLNLFDTHQPAVVPPFTLTAWLEEYDRPGVDKGMMADFLAGPPSSVPESQPQLDAMGQPVVDPLTGQPQMIRLPYWRKLYELDRKATVAMLREMEREERAAPTGGYA